MKNTLIVFFLLITLSTFGQDTQVKKFKPYKYSVGILGGYLGNYQVLGVQGEVKFFKKLSFRLVGTRYLGFTKKDDYALGGLGILTYYIPTKCKYIEPIIGVGGVYSRYHWDINQHQGTLNDFNVGGGIGANARFSNWGRLGLIVFAANSFNPKYSNNEMRSEGRKLLLLPVLTFDILF